MKKFGAPVLADPGTGELWPAVPVLNCSGKAPEFLF
jgi:hypothetical protein